MAYTYKKRADNGFDFFDNSGRKTTIEQYTKNTGTNQGQLRNYLASQGDRQSQAIIKPAQTISMPKVNMPAQTKVQPVKQKSVWENIGDFGKAVGSGLQQGLGGVADVAIQGGGVIGRLGVQSNPLIDNKRREQELQKYDQNLTTGNTGSQSLRQSLQSQKDLQGNKIVGTSDVDQNATRIASGKGTLQDYGAVAGKGLQVGLDATMFANPARIGVKAAGGVAKTPASKLLQYAGRDAAFFGGTQGVATTAQTYGQTGDIGKSLEAGGKSALLTGVTAGGLDIAGAGLGKAINVAKNTPREVKTGNLLRATDSVGTKNTPVNKLTSYEGAPDRARVEQYKQRIQSGQPIDPIIVMRDSRGKLGIEDGKHRYQAARELGITNIPTREVNAGSMRAVTQRGSVGGEAPKQRATSYETPLTQDTPIPRKGYKNGQPIVEAPQRQTSFANRTVQASQEVSDATKAQVRSGKPTYQATTDAERLALSDAYLKKGGLSKANTDIKERLNSKNLDDQTVSDAIATAKALDAKGTKQSLVDASDIYERLGEKLSKAGQTIQAASLLNNRTPQGLQYSALRALKKAGVEITPKIKSDITQLIGIVKKQKAGTYEDGLARFKVQEYVNKNTPSSTAGKAIQLWKAGLLTSPRTTTGNLLGNISENFFRKGYVDPLANLTDALFSVFTKKRSRSFTTKGIFDGAGEGIDKTIKYFKTGYDPRNPAQKFDVRQIHYSDKPLGKAAEAYTQSVFKLMGGADQPFYYAAQRNSLFDLAITEAKNRGLKGAEKKAFIRDFVENPQKKDLQLADAEARYAVFQDETALGKAASRLKTMEGIPGDVADFVVPFTGVPSSIATRMVMRTPIGIAHEIIKQVTSKKFNQRALTSAIANGTAFIPLMGAGYALANSGEMTLGYPTDKTERDLWEAEGKQPYSIRVGDKWLSLNYVQPVGNLMAAGAELAGKIKDGGTVQEAISTSLAGAGKALSEQSFLQGILSIGNAISDPSRFGQKFTESTAGSIVPNLIRAVARATDPYGREVNGIIDSVKAGIPGARQTLDQKTNILGQPVERRSSPVNEIFNPFRPSDVKNEGNVVVGELRRLQDAKQGITPTQATKNTIDGISEEQVKELNQRTSEQVSTEFENVISDPRYQQLTDEDKKRLLERVNKTIYDTIKSDYSGDVKLTKLSQLYKRDGNVDFYDGFDATTDDPIGTKLDNKSQAYNFLLSSSAVPSLEKDTWNKEAVSSNYQPLIDNINSKLPSGWPKVANTNEVAELYAKFEKDKADNNWSQLQTQTESKNLIANAYKANLSDNERFITTLSDKDIIAAANSGMITKAELDKIIATDDALIAMGKTPALSNKTRATFGYGGGVQSSGSGKSGRKDYKLYGFAQADPNTVTGNLRKLIESAKI